MSNNHYTRVAIITCVNAENYGAVLQCLALSRFISDIGYKVEVIDYKPYYMDFGTDRWYNPGIRLKEWCKLILRYRRRCSDISKRLKLRGFIEKNIPLTTSTYHNLSELTDNAPNADVYIAGSDQIWNPELPNGNDKAFYLSYGSSDVRRISYAASFAIAELPTELKKGISDMISRLNAVSVREESAVDICANLQIKATLVCDPVLLMPKDFWTDLCQGCRIELSAYLLVYDFMGSEEIRKVAKRISKLRRLKIFSASPMRLGYADRNLSDCSPYEFIALIRDAECVVSNSLHGSLFAMIFRKNFFVVERADGLNIRMTDLMARYGLTSKIVGGNADDICLSQEIDYNYILNKLESDINQSKEWIQTQLT